MAYWSQNYQHRIRNMEESERYPQPRLLMLVGYILDPILHLYILISNLTNYYLARLVPATPPDIQLETNSTWGKVGNAIFQLILLAIYYVTMGLLSFVISIGSSFLLCWCSLSLILDVGSALKLTSAFAVILLTYWKLKTVKIDSTSQQS